MKKDEISENNPGENKGVLKSKLNMKSEKTKQAKKTKSKLKVQSDNNSRDNLKEELPESLTPMGVVMFRNKFYQDNYKRYAFLLLLSIILNFILLIGTVYLVMDEPAPVYFATNEDGTLRQLVPIDEPYLDDEQVIAWAVEAAIYINRYNFANWQYNFDTIQQFFTRRGFQEYQRALDASGNLRTVINQRYVVSGTVAGIPEVVSKGLLVGGRYGWRIQIPMIITYESASTSYRQPVTITMLVGRVPTTEAAEGVKIASFISASRSIPN